MFFVSDNMKKAPDTYYSHLQETVYESLTKLPIPFEGSIATLEYD